MCNRSGGSMYTLLQRSGVSIGHPELKPHDLRQQRCYLAYASI